MKIDEKKRMQEMVSGHRTGLPDKLLRLFNARAPLEPNKGPPRRSRPPKLPYTGVAQYVQLFAEPGESEYEPPPPETRPPEPRIFANPELPSQVRGAGLCCAHAWFASCMMDWAVCGTRAAVCGSGLWAGRRCMASQRYPHRAAL